MAAATATKPKKGLFSKLRRKKNKEETPVEESKKNVTLDELLEVTPPSSPVASDTPEPAQESALPRTSKKSFAKDGGLIVTGNNPDDFVPSDVQPTAPGKPIVSNPKKDKKRSVHRRKITIDKAPTARESAFSGPPRYDWIDVETAAALKVQAAYRRNKVMSQLEAQGISTPAMRNRTRRRQANRHMQVSDDTPSLFRCCGLGLVFGDGTEEDFLVTRAHEKEEYEEKKRLKAEREAELRKPRYRHKPSAHMMEAVEVVEDEDVEQL